jgi:hypothetical protein
MLRSESQYAARQPLLAMVPTMIGVALNMTVAEKTTRTRLCKATRYWNVGLIVPLNPGLAYTSKRR